MIMGKYFTSLKLGFINSLEYRIDLVFTILTSIFPIVIQLFMWVNVFNQGEELIFGYTLNQLVCYTILSNFVTSLITTNIYSTISNDVKSGKLNSYLIKPMNYISFRTFGILGSKITEFLLISILGIIAIIFLMSSSELGLTNLNILFFVISLILSYLLNLFLYISFSCTAFWITENSRLFAIFKVIMSVIGGSIFPIDIFGKLFTDISRFMPFQNLVYVPLNIIMGKTPINEIPGHLIIQGVWVLLFAFFALMLWNKGIKKYIGVGG